MEEIVKFLKKAETYYLATVEGDQPRVRPFGTAHIFEGKLYIQTGKKKDVSKQLHANPKAELCAFKGGEWIRVAGELVEDDRIEARESMLDAYPGLKKMYAADDPAASIGTISAEMGNLYALRLASLSSKRSMGRSMRSMTRDMPGLVC